VCSGGLDISSINPLDEETGGKLSQLQRGRRRLFLCVVPTRRGERATV
jgi:hypothetical protein